MLFDPNPTGWCETFSGVKGQILVRRAELGQIKLAQVWAQVQCENVPHVDFSKSQWLSISHILETRDEKMQPGLASRQRRHSNNVITEKRKSFAGPAAKTRALIGNMASS